ncbi:MAG: hypothetical protein Kow00105_05880 [Phycisphaeraceae bacterium]
MQLATLMYGAGSVGPFASRAFMPAFVTALALRFAPEYAPWFPDDMAGIAQQAPSWFTSDLSLIAFGLLALLELAATKNPDLRAMWSEVESYAKSAVAVVTYLGIASTQDVGFVERATQQAGFADVLPALVIGAGVFRLSQLKTEAFRPLSDADEDDDLGIQGLMSWAEDIWAGFGPILLLLFPLVMLALIALVAVVLLWIQRRAIAIEEQSKIPCTQCGESIYRSALRCPSCGHDNPEPCDVSLFGRSLERPAPDAETHAMRLVERKRCPVCATRLEKRSVSQTCSGCGHALFADPAFAQRYLARSEARLPMVLLISALFSAVPVVGLIPGVIYYRLTLISPLRRYIPRGKSILLRWVVRIVLFFLILFQWVPAAGALVVPAMALINYGVYRSAFRAALASRSES